MPKTNNASLLCIPDTNSLIHMRDIEVINNKLWKWLWIEFDVKLSETICDELDRSDKTDAGMENECEKSIWSFGKSKSNLTKLEQVFVEQFNINVDGRKNKGECHNCCVALDAILSGGYRQVIFLTNELKATDPDRDGQLFHVFDSIPIGKIWSSLDFVLYLYTRHRRLIDLTIVKDILKEINVRMGGSTSGNNNVVLKRLKVYYSKLEKIENTIAQLPH